MFDVVADVDAAMLRIRLRGFWTIETMAAYMKDVGKAMGHLRAAGRLRHVLINMIDYPIQSKPIAEAHAANLVNAARTGNLRVALVLQSELSKLQAARVASATGHRTFATEKAALEWLLHDRSN